MMKGRKKNEEEKEDLRLREKLAVENRTKVKVEMMKEGET